MGFLPYLSGQITIIPKPEFVGHFGGIPLQSPPFGGFIPNRRRELVGPYNLPRISTVDG